MLLLLNGCALLQSQARHASEQRALGLSPQLLEVTPEDIERLGGRFRSIPWGERRAEHMRLRDDTPVLLSAQDSAFVGVALNIPGPVSLLKVSPDLRFWENYATGGLTLPAQPQDLEVVQRKTLLYTHGAEGSSTLLQMPLEGAHSALELAQQVRDFYLFEELLPEQSLLVYQLKESQHTSAQGQKQNESERFETRLRLYSNQHPQGLSLLSLPAEAGRLQAVAWPRSDRLYLVTRAAQSSRARFWQWRQK